MREVDSDCTAEPQIDELRVFVFVSPRDLVSTRVSSFPWSNICSSIASGVVRLSNYSEIY